MNPVNQLRKDFPELTYSHTINITTETHLEISCLAAGLGCSKAHLTRWLIDRGLANGAKDLHNLIKARQEEKKGLREALGPLADALDTERIS